MNPDALFWRSVLTCLFVAVCVTDWRARRIPNALVAGVLILGLARGLLIPMTGGANLGTLAAGPGAAVVGVGVGLAAWLPLYALGVLGAGDVKLFAAAGAWLGPHGVLPASVYAALAGGVLGLAWVVRGLAASHLPGLAAAVAGSRGAGRGAGDTRVPYGMAITAGVLAVAWGATTP